MSRKFWLPAILAIVLVLAIGGAALAQSATPPASQGIAPGTAMPNTPGLGKGFGFGFGGRFGSGNNWTVYDAVAQALKLTPAQLFDQLHSGKTLAQIAQAQGVDMTTVQTAAQNAAKQAEQNAINQAVQSGRITQAQGNWLLQGLQNGWLGRGFGGFGPGMHRGMRNGMGTPGGKLQPNGQPTATPNS